MIELNQILLADCMDVMKDIPDKYFELAIVDPPYGIGVNHNMGRRHGDMKSNYKPAEWDQFPPDDKYFNDLFRISINQIIWGANHLMDKIGKSSACWIVWDKLFSEDVSFASAELAWTSFNSVVKKFVYSSADKSRIHPTQKPVALYRWLLQNYAKIGDKIIDTHSGSGSCAIACHIEKHDFLAIEKDPDYHAASVKRLEEVRAQGVLF